MKKTTMKVKERRTVMIAIRTTPAIKRMLEELALKGFRSAARENERLIIEAHSKL